jgi:cell division transport system permease protein
MLSRLGYFSKETLISLRRNLMMTVAGIMTVIVSLTLFGGILLIQRLVEHGTSKWKHGVELEIFMNVEASQTQIDDVKKQLEDSEDIRKVRFLSKEDAYEEFKRIFKDQPALIESTTADALPTSFRVTPTDAELTEGIKARFEGVPGVNEVITAQETIKNILRITGWIRIIFITMAIALLVSSLFLIVNTIRLATFARRREIEVMQLVGASNWFVRIPFMAEGFVQGAVGAGVAWGFIWLLQVVLSDNINGSGRSITSTFYVTSGDAFAIGLLLMFIGAGIGVVGSLIGLRRYLEA